MTPKDAGKKRLRMILVADRCGMNQASLFEMKHSIVQVSVASVFFLPPCLPAWVDALCVACITAWGQLVMRRCARLVPACRVHTGLQVCCSWSHTCSFELQQGTVGSVVGCIDRLLQRCAHQEVQWSHKDSSS